MAVVARWVALGPAVGHALATSRGVSSSLEWMDKINIQYSIYTLSRFDYTVYQTSPNLLPNFETPSQTPGVEA